MFELTNQVIPNLFSITRYLGNGTPGSEGMIYIPPAIAGHPETCASFTNGLVESESSCPFP